MGYYVQNLRYAVITNTSNKSYSGVTYERRRGLKRTPESGKHPLDRPDLRVLTNGCIFDRVKRDFLRWREARSSIAREAQVSSTELADASCDARPSR